MKVYSVIISTPYNNNASTLFFSSKTKAINYIKKVFEENNESPRGDLKNPNSYNNEYCKEVNILFDIKNWNKYRYVIKNGTGTLRIESVEIM